MKMLSATIICLFLYISLLVRIYTCWRVMYIIAPIPLLLEESRKFPILLSPRCRSLLVSKYRYMHCDISNVWYEYHWDTVICKVIYPLKVLLIQYVWIDTVPIQFRVQVMYYILYVKKWLLACWLCHLTTVTTGLDRIIISLILWVYVISYTQISLLQAPLWASSKMSDWGMPTTRGVPPPDIRMF